MKPKERQAKIAEIVGRQGRMTVEALSAHFGVSAETIRRDLGELAESGAVQKIHGGVKPLKLHLEGSFQERMAEDAAGKRVIARKLLGLVEPGDTIFIDTGSTTLICAEELSVLERLTVITNSVRIAQVFASADNGASVYLLGGAFSADNSETIGPIAIEQIASFHADHAILTVAAIDHEVGATDANFDEAQIARAMARNSRHVYVVASGAKFGRRAAFSVCTLTQIGVIVSDSSPSPEFLKALRASDTEML